MGKEVPENIRLAARADGVLVKPDHPMVPTDDTYLREASGGHGPVIAWTCTDHGEHRTVYAFAFMPGKGKEMGGDFSWSITPSAFGMQSPTYVYDVVHKQGVALAAGKTYDANGSQYALVIIAPIGPSGIAFLGDPDKIASTGKQRVGDIRESSENLTATILTASGETAVTLHGFAETAPICQLADGKNLPVQYVVATKHFTVVVPSARNEQAVTFRPVTAQK